MNNYFKFKWIEHFNQKAEIVKVEKKKSRFMYLLTFHGSDLKDTSGLQVKYWEIMYHM